MDDAVNDLESSQVNDGITDKEKCAISLEDFALTYFHHIFKSECCSFHHYMFKDAEGLILDTIATITNLFVPLLVVMVNLELSQSYSHFGLFVTTIVKILC